MRGGFVLWQLDLDLGRNHLLSINSWLVCIVLWHSTHFYLLSACMVCGEVMSSRENLLSPLCAFSSGCYLEKGHHFRLGMAWLFHRGCWSATSCLGKFHDSICGFMLSIQYVHGLCDCWYIYIYIYILPFKGLYMITKRVHEDLDLALKRIMDVRTPTFFFSFTSTSIKS